MTAPRTLFEKLWERHLVRPQTDATPAVLYIDLHLVHEVTSPQAFTELREARPEGAPPASHRRDDGPLDADDAARLQGDAGARPSAQSRKAQLDQLAKNCAEFGIPLLALGDERQGIVHVIGPELGLTQPGMTVVCGDSHTSTHGAFGALAFGIGTSARWRTCSRTQCLLQTRPKTLEVRVDGDAALGRLGQGRHPGR